MTGVDTKDRILLDLLCCLKDLRFNRLHGNGCESWEKVMRESANAIANAEEFLATKISLDTAHCLKCDSVYPHVWAGNVLIICPYCGNAEINMTVVQTPKDPQQGEHHV